MNSVRQSWSDTRALRAIGAAAEEISHRVENISSNGSTTFVNGNLLVSGEITSKSFISYPSTYTSKFENIEPNTTSYPIQLDENGTTDKPYAISEVLTAGSGLFNITLTLYTSTEITASDVFVARFTIGEDSVLANGAVEVDDSQSSTACRVHFSTSFVAYSNAGDTINIEILTGVAAVEFTSYNNCILSALRTGVSA